MEMHFFISRSPFGFIVHQKRQLTFDDAYYEVKM